ncbi:terpene synthase [Plantactinospora sp. KBS50]|uniref:terpene synthase family protein n=1 Tax=Plantactinospora sp. KBS50 TaxID=2024580 RepID=UPI000BAB14F2|nr:terpene synthase [Plantactinospora sp. KBS50]ASW55997.1 terpene synthase [Plantactinospora sp. KBS50]
MRTFAASALIEPPFPARLNAHSAAAADRSGRWAAELGLAATPDDAGRLARANAADLAGRACPDAAPEHLELLTDLITWLFAFDDRCDDDGLGADPGRLAPVVARLLDIVDLIGDDAPAQLLESAGPIGVALHDLGRRVRAQSPPALLLRFATELRDYLLALLWEAANRAQRRRPVVSEYIQMRRHTGAVYPSLTLTDAAHHADPDATWLADSRVSKLDLLAVDLVCWCNDIFSYDKERRAGSDGHNLAAAVANETGLDEAKALAAAANRFNDALEAYLRLEPEVLAGGDPQVARFAAARRCWIRGTYDWSLRAARYH